MMGLEGSRYVGTQQTYSGMVALRKTTDTLHFLGEWDRWSDRPVAAAHGLLGSDVAFNISRARIRHNGDQSVFSLLAKRYRMKHWPATYHIVGDTGLEECRKNWIAGGYCPFLGPEPSGGSRCLNYGARKNHTL